jgi:hypothetical protein
MTEVLMSKKESPQELLNSNLPLINLNAAGIDIGADRHWVSVRVDRDENPVRSFGCFTAELYAMADWLKQCHIETVAMESTGVYWIPVFQILESREFEVKLVNAHFPFERLSNDHIPRSGHIHIIISEL